MIFSVCGQHNALSRAKRCPRPRGVSASLYTVIEVQLTFSAIWSITLHDSETFTVRKVDHK